MRTNTFNKLLMEGGIGIKALMSHKPTPKMIITKIRLSSGIINILI
jgi:hypothetical protein